MAGRVLVLYSAAFPLFTHYTPMEISRSALVVHSALDMYQLVHDVAAYPEFLNRSLRNRVLKGDNPFEIPNFFEVGSAKEREQIYNSDECAIVLATSGMLNGGTSVEYFRNFAPHEKNSIVFVGYQASGTLGRRVKDGEKEILLSNTGSVDDKVTVNMKVYEMKGAFSAHSDIALTRKFLSNLSVKPKKVILNHGEISKIISFSENVKRIIQNVKVYSPENLESIRLQ